MRSLAILAALAMAACSGSALPGPSGTTGSTSTSVPTGTSSPSPSTSAPSAPEVRSSTEVFQTICPPDVSAPIPMVACTTAREPVDGKLEPQQRAILEAATTAPIDVMIGVRGDHLGCPIGDCRTPPCPAFEATTTYWVDENLAAQKCVRAWVAAVGGTSRPEAEALWITNAFVASLTWSQIQQVAAHPDVRLIEANAGGPPP